MNINDAIKKAKKKEFQYPELRQGEEFVSDKIFLSLKKTENDIMVTRPELYDNIEAALTHFQSLNLKGNYYVHFDQSKIPNSWRIDLEY